MGPFIVAALVGLAVGVVSAFVSDRKRVSSENNMRFEYNREVDLTAKYTRARTLTDMAANLDSLIGICEPAESQGLKLASKVCRNWAGQTLAPPSVTVNLTADTSKFDDKLNGGLL
ncbi:MAG TPA: hypothetical protein VGL75_07400 [Acidothermaceae bacterium]|jgi:hypothetical protein